MSIGEIVKVSGNSWPDFQLDVMILENIFPGTLVLSKAQKQKVYSLPSLVAFHYIEDGRVLGEILGYDAADMFYSTMPEVKNYLSEKYPARVMYWDTLVVGYSVEDREKRAEELIISLIGQAKADGYDFLIGHAKEGKVTDISQ